MPGGPTKVEVASGIGNWHLDGALRLSADGRAVAASSTRRAAKPASSAARFPATCACAVSVASAAVVASESSGGHQQGVRASFAASQEHLQ